MIKLLSLLTFCIRLSFTFWVKSLRDALHALSATWLRYNSSQQRAITRRCALPVDKYDPHLHPVQLPDLG